MSLRCREVSFVGVFTWTITSSSPLPFSRRLGIPFFRRRKMAPLWVPGGTTIFASPSKVGTSTSPPRTALERLKPILQTRSFLCLLKTSCGLTSTTTYRSPLCPPPSAVSPSPRKTNWEPVSTPGGILMLIRLWRSTIPAPRQTVAGLLNYRSSATTFAARLNSRKMHETPGLDMLNLACASAVWGTSSVKSQGSHLSRHILNIVHSWEPQSRWQAQSTLARAISLDRTVGLRPSAGGVARAPQRRRQRLIQSHQHRNPMSLNISSKFTPRNMSSVEYCESIPAWPRRSYCARLSSSERIA